MIWAVLVVMIVLAAQAGWLWYGSQRLLAATSQAQHWRLLRQATSVSLGVGAAILIAGVVLFVAKGYNWFILAVSWPFGLLHIGLNVAAFRRTRKRTGRIPGTPR